MKTKLLLDRRITVSENAFVEMVLWHVPEPVKGSVHGYKYRLAYIVNGACVLRYDNEAGKGDHRHYGDAESAILFHDPGQLVADFMNDVKRWDDENRCA